MAQYENILYDLPAPGVAKVTLNRPDRLNAYTNPLLSELADAFRQAKADENVRVVIVTGAGRGFCAGQDLAANTAEMDFEKGLKEYYRPMILALADLGKPSIAMVNGAAAGAGMSLALACDFRIAAQNAKFVTAFAGIALVPDAGMSYHLPRLVGLARAQEMITFNRPVGADEALSIGLVTKIAPADQLEATTLAFAGQLVNIPTVAFALTRQMLHRSFDLDLSGALAQEEKNQPIAGATADFMEGIRAFMEKRAPQFKGK